MSASSATAVDPPRRLCDALFRWRGWLAIALLAATVVIAWPRPLDPRLPFVLAAIPLVLLGASLRLWARSHFLRGSDTRKVQSHRLVLGGPYSHVRNPLYVGNILGQTGLVLAFTTPWIALGFGLLLLLLYQGVIASEEAVLLRSHGEPYARFREVVPRWLPRLSPYREPDTTPTCADWGTALRRERQRLTGYLLGLAVALGLTIL